MIVMPTLELVRVDISIIVYCLPSPVVYLYIRYSIELIDSHFLECEEYLFDYLLKSTRYNVNVGVYLKAGRFNALHDVIGILHGSCNH